MNDDNDKFLLFNVFIIIKIDFEIDFDLYDFKQHKII